MTNNIFNPSEGASFDANGALVTTPAAVNTETPAVETPAVETPKEETPVDTAVATTAPEIDWGTALSEKTGGKYKSWDELTTKLSEAPAEPAYANEESKKIAQYLKEGKVDDVLQVYNEQRRLSAAKDLSDAEVVKLAMEYKHAGLSAEDIQEEFQSKYTAEKPEEPNQDDYLDDESFEKAQKDYKKDLAKYEKAQKSLQRQLKLEASESRDYLQSLVKDIVLPDISSAEPHPDPAEYESSLKAWEQNRQSYLSSLEKSSADFKEIPFEVNDEGVTFKGSYQIDEAERQALQKDLAEKNVMDDLLLSRYVKGDNYDTKQLMEDLYWLNNKDKIIASAVKQALASGKLEKIKEQKNIDLNGQHRENFTPSTEQQVKEMASTWFAAG